MKQSHTTQFDISLLAGSGHLELGIEGIQHGLSVEVVLRTLFDGEELADDAICVLNAPFILNSNLDTAAQVYVGTTWSDFNDDVETALAQGLNMSENDFIRVPVAFKVAGGGPSETGLPNMINMIVVKNANGTRKLVVPQRFSFHWR